MMQPESCKSHCSVISRQRPLDSIWEERVLPHGEERGNKKHMLGGVRIPFPFGEGERKPQRTRWKHSFSSDYLSSYTGTFVWLFLMQKLDARPCCHYETWSAGKFHSRSPFPPPQSSKNHSHLILKEALVDSRDSPVMEFSAMHTKLPASCWRSTAVNLRLLPSRKRRGLSSRGWPL